jgi:hypothetical protein
MVTSNYSKTVKLKIRQRITNSVVDQQQQKLDPAPASTSRLISAPPPLWVSI